jgi:UDP-3-O-[3-hydroxymyristoyl] glucosamine N-acyltransferase
MTPPYTTGTLAQRLGAELIGSPDLPLSGLEVIERAGPGTLTFIRDKNFAKQWHTSKSPAALITKGLVIPEFDHASRALLVVKDADLALNTVLELYTPPPARPAPGIHPTASIDPTARIGQGVTIGPGCIIEAGASVGDGTVMRGNVFIGAHASVGRMCHMHANVSILDRCKVGDGCNFFPGVVIGADGFGYRPSPDGRGVVKIPHTGTVEIGSGVEIGANTCIDRAKFGATVVGDGCKFDNLVQIGHGVRMGRACLFASGTAVGGSCTFGDGVMVGGQVGIAEGHHMGSGSRIGAQSGVLDDVPAGETWLGTPGMLASCTLRSWANWRRTSSDRAKRSNAKKEKKS